MELYDEYAKNIDTFKKFFGDIYAPNPAIYSSLTGFVSKIDKINYNKVKEYFKVNNLQLFNNEWYEKYYYALMKGEAYWYEFADLHLKDLKDYIKANYTACLKQEAMKWFCDIFKSRWNIIPYECLQEYSGKNRSRETIKKEGTYITSKEIYYLNPLIDEMWETHQYDKIETLQGTKILNIRGTNGSGKTTLVNGLYLSSDHKETVAIKLHNRRGQEHDRFFDVLYDKHVVLLGGYNSEYGTKGVDRMDDVTEIVQGIMYVINNYPGWTIIMESATVSTSFWSYAILFDLLQKQGVDVKIVNLLMKDWDFVVNNVRNRTKRKEGAKEPKWEEIKNKRFILYKNHLRFNSILGKSYIEYPDTYSLENKHLLMEKILCIK